MSKSRVTDGNSRGESRVIDAHKIEVIGPGEAPIVPLLLINSDFVRLESGLFGQKSISQKK